MSEAVALTAPKSVAKTMELAAACAGPADTLIRTHLIKERKRAWPAGSIRRAGGPPIGVDEHTRPRYHGAYMQHLLTLDLDDTPELRALPRLATARAVAVFISDADDNIAWELENTCTAVLPLTEQDLAKGEWAGPAVGDPPPRWFDLYPVDVPARAFADYLDEETTDRPLWKLWTRMMSLGRVGGPVVHWSGATRTEDFVMQFHEEVVDVNLGDAGTMYVFTDRAFSASH